MNWSIVIGKRNTTHHVRRYLSRAKRDKKNGEDSRILYVWKMRENLGYIDIPLVIFSSYRLYEGLVAFLSAAQS